MEIMNRLHHPNIVEFLCSGETTAGKLLMHFLLYYGQHFDALGTAIDVSGKHERDFIDHMFPYAYLSPYIQRQTPGSIDPNTKTLRVAVLPGTACGGFLRNRTQHLPVLWNAVRLRPPHPAVHLCRRLRLAKGATGMVSWTTPTRWAT